ncbi:phosphoenolpyruvate synthase [Candidatus Woesearchaeota archaeon]|nr:phosphoenolpyruvate synthase [Candidatus Woesearchaeota archaeon]
MYRSLTGKGVKIPNGFAVTAFAYNYFLEKAKIKNQLKVILKSLDKNKKNLADIGQKARATILKAELPQELKNEIIISYQKLCRQYGANTDVAVRSSATAEDLPDASFAGQQETYLNIRGEHALVEAAKKCFASLFTNRAISYRVDKHFDHLKVYLSVGVQKMVRSDKACSGVMFSIDTETGFKDAVLINAAYGLGENVVQGSVNPDQFYVFKPALNKGFKPVISKKIGTKKIKMIYSKNSRHPTQNVGVPPKERLRFVLNDDEILKLAKWACIIEDYYSKKAKKFKPMDMEWAKDGATNELFIVQARPETVQSQKNVNLLEEYVLKEKSAVILTGLSVGMKIGTGKAHVIKDAKDIKNFKHDEVLITEKTDPDWEPIMKIASAIVTNKGGRTCFSGDTKILTNKGFMEIKDIHENYEGLMVPSLNRITLKMEWKKIYASMKRRGELIEIVTSQTGKAKNNTLNITKDHRVLTFCNRKLISKEINKIFLDGDHLLIAQYLPSPSASDQKDRKLAYMLGAIMTDGHIHTSRTHGEITFIQSPAEKKRLFVDKMQEYAFELFGKKFKVSRKSEIGGVIDGRQIMGSGNAYRLYSKELAYELKSKTAAMAETLLHSDEELIKNFLAGVIDGDGTYSSSSNRINIYCSKKNLFEAIIISCLRIGIVPQVCRNRNIWNIQIVENVEELFKYTNRVKGNFNRKRQGTRFFSAKQILGDIIEEANYKGRIKNYINKNLMIDTEKIKNFVIPLCSKKIKKEILNIYSSDLRMFRSKFARNIGFENVYNISVEGNHNYVVFTKDYTPVLVENCHAAIITRELGIPCIVGTEKGTEIVKTGTDVTVSCAEGEVGKIYKGKLKFDIRKIDLKKLKRPKTKIMMNVGNPDQAFEFSFIPNDGVGLAREEFIISSYIKVHPLALLHFDKIKDKNVKEAIDNLTYAYKNKVDFFVEKLAQGVAMIGAAFHPKDVIVRMSDFKTNEYANLIGGNEFEPKEENPMLGWRGASRYYFGSYREAFGLECLAMKKARDEMGLANVKLMVPFCRTVEEGKLVIAEMKKYGLVQGKNGLEIYVMCEIPSNVILADDFAEIFDGFSIGSNDLTQLTLGLDRDSELVSRLYDERNPAVKKLIAEVINRCKKNKTKIGICGQASSDYPDFAQFLVQCGIDSISLNPDTVVKTTIKILETEQKLKRKKH